MNKKKIFSQAINGMDAFKAHFMDDVAALLIDNIVLVKVPAGCTSTVQPLDVSINKPFKSILRECFGDHIIDANKDARDETSNNPNKQ